MYQDKLTTEQLKLAQRGMYEMIVTHNDLIGMDRIENGYYKDVTGLNIVTDSTSHNCRKSIRVLRDMLVGMGITGDDFDFLYFDTYREMKSQLDHDDLFDIDKLEMLYDEFEIDMTEAEWDDALGKVIKEGTDDE